MPKAQNSSKSIQIPIPSLQNNDLSQISYTSKPCVPPPGLSSYKFPEEAELLHFTQLVKNQSVAHQQINEEQERANQIQNVKFMLTVDQKFLKEEVEMDPVNTSYKEKDVAMVDLLHGERTLKRSYIGKYLSKREPKQRKQFQEQSKENDCPIVHQQNNLRDQIKMFQEQAVHEQDKHRRQLFKKQVGYLKEQLQLLDDYQLEHNELDTLQQQLDGITNEYQTKREAYEERVEQLEEETTRLEKENSTMNIKQMEQTEKEQKQLEESIRTLSQQNQQLREEQLIRQQDLDDLLDQQKGLQKTYQSAQESLRTFERQRSIQ